MFDFDGDGVTDPGEEQIKSRTVSGLSLFVVMSCDPSGEAVQAGVDNPLVYVELVQDIPELPAEGFVNDVFDGFDGGLLQESRDIVYSGGDDGKEGILVDDPLVHGRGLQADKGPVAHVLIIVPQ